jgi:hypothetical protein
MTMHGRRRVLVSVMASWLVLFGGAFADAAASEPSGAEQIVGDNRLLGLIHRRNPELAKSFVAEIREKIALLDRRGGRGNGAARIPLHRRDPMGAPPSPSVETLDERTRKDLGENPLLRDLYARSPLASLRMLERMREAAGQGKSVAK